MEEQVEGQEGEEQFLARRAAEERRKMEETSCMVRAVHEELAEGYEERGDEVEAATAELESLLTRIEDEGA